jgi:cell division protein FtsN
MMNTERRHSPRTTAEKLVYIHLEPDSGAIVLNVSDGGFGFHAVAPVRETGTIRLWFSLQTKQRIEASAELAWTDETKKTGGLRLILSPSDLNQLRNSLANSPIAAGRPTPKASPPAAQQGSSGFIADEPGASVPFVPRISPQAAAPLPETDTLGQASAEVEIPTGEPTALPAALPAPVPFQAVAEPPMVKPLESRNESRSLPGVPLPYYNNTPYTATYYSRASQSRGKFSRGFAAGVLTSTLLGTTCLLFVYRAHIGNSLIELGQHIGGKVSPQAISAPAAIPTPTPVDTAVDTAVNSAPLSESLQQLSAEIAELDSEPESLPAKVSASSSTTRGNASLRPPITASPSRQVALADSLPVSSPAPHTAAAATLDPASSPLRVESPGGAAGNPDRQDLSPASTNYFEVGSFKDSSRADAAKNSLAQLGYEATIVHKGHLWMNSYHVIVGPYDDRNAETVRAKLESNGFLARPTRQ